LLVERSRTRLGLFAVALGCAGLALRFVQQVLFLDGRTDLFWDFGQYYRAAVDVGRGLSPYRDYMQSGGAYDIGYGFNYPPLVAEMLRPLTALSEPAAFRAWTCINYALVAIAAVAAWLTVRGRVGRGALLLLALAALLFLPLYQGLYLGNLHVFLLASLAICGLALSRERAGPAAVVLTVAAAVKVLPLLAAPVLGGRPATSRHARDVLPYVLAVAVFAAFLLAVPWTGEYLFHVLPRLSRKAGDLAPGGLSYGLLVNESLPGALARAEVLIFGRRVPLADQAGTVISAAMFVATCVVTSRRRAGDSAVVALAAFVSLIPIVSTITWAHHLVLELLVIALLLPHLHVWSWRTCATVCAYPMLLVSKATILPVVSMLGLAHPSGAGIVLFIGLTSVNLAGMTTLWAVALLTARDAGRPVAG
jgi:hypothetical protein